MALLRRIESSIELDTTPPSPVNEEHEQHRAVSDGGESEDVSLCNRCRDFDIQAFSRCADRRRGFLMLDVARTAKTDNPCSFCSLLWESVKNVHLPVDVEEKPDLSRLWSTPPAGRPDYYIHMTLSTDYSSISKSREPFPEVMRANRLRTEIADRFSEVRNASDHELCLAADPGSLAATEGDVLGRYLGRDPGSEAHYELIREWIEECYRHPKCNQTVSGSESIDTDRSPLPARCVEILRDGGQIKIRLRRTARSRGTYLTLSHQWNEETERCKTTVDNYEERSSSIQLERLPKLFQDVIHIAATLEVRFAWIDSLCIIQSGDNGADWALEAPKMAEYYQYSLLTVAGTRSDPMGGLLYPYSEDFWPWESGLVRLPYRDKNGYLAGDFYVYKRANPLSDDFRTLVRESPLSRRGWVLQEWLLSKRVLWYTSRGLFFECHTGEPRTEYRERILVEACDDNMKAYINLKTSFHFENEYILDFWYRALEVYSACSLSQPNQDRILAVAGLAKEVGLILSRRAKWSHVHITYLCGLWLQDLHHGILWEEDKASSSQPQRVENLPSWSWASIMTRVRWPHQHKGLKPAFRVEGICLSKRSRHEMPEVWVEESSGIHLPGYSDSGGVEEAAIVGAFDPTNMFACLHIRASLYTVHVRGYLDTKDNLETAAFATAYDFTPTSSQWRAICDPQAPERIAGWGSLEQLTSEEGICDDTGIAINALHVSTREVQSGLFFKHKDPVIDILLVRKISDTPPTFCRLGVGRIFDRDVIREVSVAKEQSIQLV